MSNSAYVSENPVYDTSGSAGVPLVPSSHGSRMRAIKTVTENEPALVEASGPAEKEAFRNSIYDNVKINIPVPNADIPAFCKIDDNGGTDGANPSNGETGNDDGTGTPKNGQSVIGEVKELVAGIPKKYLWAGGIATGILILGRASKNG